MSGSGFAWVVPPSVLTKGLADYEYKILLGLYAIASKWGQDTQDDARKSGPWEDRTANARSGIFYAVDGFGFAPIIGQINVSGIDMQMLESGTEVNRGRTNEVTVESGSKDTLIIVVAHTVFYGKFLELSHGGKYAIIMSTIEKNLPNLQAMVQDFLKG